MAVTITRIDIAEEAVRSYSGVYTGARASYLSTSPQERDEVSYRGVGADEVEQHWAQALGAP
ncbi:hypothetical protein [Serinicoccus sp. CNJ-927]|uniref:hypothetical protein n=1 Tax=Serinicoccus sp. CNJ-927 TaxID=1904970 RepID=UPI00117B666B|nr:hypothetical protein [Serinicoccus sp. CNJ-927]